MTHRLPSWIEERGGTLHLIPARAATVKRIYKLAAAGYSATSIVKLFRAEEPIPNYFPAVITEAEWHAARGALAGRQFPPSRTSKYVFLFSGLLRDARDGTSYYRQVAGNGRANDALVNRTEDNLPKRSFPLKAFESAILHLLAEIDPREVIGGIAEPDESASLAGEIATVEAKIADLEAALLDGDSVSVAKVLRAQETKLADLKAKLAEANQKAAHPLADSWGETKTLAGILEGAEDETDTRLRIRAALRRIVESITLLIVPRGSTRLAAVQIRFIGGERRDYLIVHQAGKGNKDSRVPARWDARSANWPAKGKGRGHELDLRDKKDVADLQALMEKIDLETLKMRP